MANKRRETAKIFAELANKYRKVANKSTLRSTVKTFRDETANKRSNWRRNKVIDEQSTTQNDALQPMRRSGE